MSDNAEGASKGAGNGFWIRAVDEMKYQGLTCRQLAQMAGCDETTIRSGLKQDSMPQAELAVKIAHALNRPAEYLITGKNKEGGSPYKIKRAKASVQRLSDYSDVVDSLNSIPPGVRTPILSMIKEIEVPYSQSKE